MLHTREVLAVLVLVVPVILVGWSSGVRLRKLIESRRRPG